MKRLKRNKGITLIALIVTIIVLLILVGVSIAMLTGTNGILTQAQKSKLSTELSSYKEQLELYKTEKLAENREFLESTLTVGKESLTYNTQSEGETGNIKTVIPNIKDEYIDKIEVIKGSLLINTQDKNEIEIAQSLGIAANPYDIVNGKLLSSNGNLLLMDDTGTVTIPDSVTKIGEGAFANLEGLKTIIIPGTVKKIGANAFAYNKTLETVIMQEGVESVGANAFENCNKLKNVQFPQSLIDIGPSSFTSTALENVNIQSKKILIREWAFYDCQNLSNVKLSEGTELIGNHSFENTSFSEITIPSTVNEIGNGVFDNNKKLDNITIKGSSPLYVYENGMLMTKEKNKILFISNNYLKSINTFSIPEGIEKFNINLTKYTNINKLVIPSTLSEMILPRSISDIEVNEGNSKFAVSNEYKILYTKDTKIINICFSKEENIDLKNTTPKLDVKELYDSAFWPATNAKKIILPDSLETIQDFVFQNCGNIQEIQIGENVSKINSLFKYMNYSGNVVIDAKNNYYTIENNVLYSKDKTTLCAVLYSINGPLKIENGIRKIEDSAFHNQNGLMQINIPNTVEEIGWSFVYCSGLTEVNIPSSVKAISSNCFERCNNLTKIDINKSVNSIPGAPWGAPKGMKVVNWN